MLVKITGYCAAWELLTRTASLLFRRGTATPSYTSAVELSLKGEDIKSSFICFAVPGLPFFPQTVADLQIRDICASF